MKKSLLGLFATVVVLACGAALYGFAWELPNEGPVAVDWELPPGGADGVKVVLPILHSLRQDVVELGKSHPQLAEAKAIEATADGWLFEHDCRDLGKRGYEDPGPFPIAIGLRVMTELERRASALPTPPAAQPTADPVAPTPATLEKWLTGKEVVEVCFAGAHMDPLKLRDSLKTKVADNDWDFRLTPGEGGGANRSFVEVCMRVSPENTRRLLSLQEELEPRGYRLDPEHTHVWSLDGDPNARAKAREMAPGVLAAAANGISTALPKAQSATERPDRAMYLAGIRYEVPGTNITGMIRISEIAATKRWQLPVVPDQVIHLPRLGLMMTVYYRPGRDTTPDDSPQRAAIRKAVNEAIVPLLKLEGDTARLHEKPLPQVDRPNPAPATEPAGIEGNPRVRWDGNIIPLAQDAVDADLAALRDVKGIVELRMGGGPVGAAGPYITAAGRRPPDRHPPPCEAVGTLGQGGRRLGNFRLCHVSKGCRCGSVQV